MIGRQPPLPDRERALRHRNRARVVALVFEQPAQAQEARGQTRIIGTELTLFDPDRLADQRPVLVVEWSAPPPMRFRQDVDRLRPSERVGTSGSAEPREDRPHDVLRWEVLALLHQQARRRDRKSHTSELQSPCNLVCRLLLEKKKKEM